jgi:hypothetical protein
MYIGICPLVLNITSSSGKQRKICKSSRFKQRLPMQQIGPHNASAGTKQRQFGSFPDPRKDAIITKAE